MRSTLFALALALPGCLIVAEDSDRSSRHAAAPHHDDAYDAERTTRLRYRADVPQVFEAARAAVNAAGYGIRDINKPGKDYWNFDAYGAHDVKIHVLLNRHNHKTRTSVEVSSSRLDTRELKRIGRQIHDAIGRTLGEKGEEYD